MQVPNSGAESQSSDQSQPIQETDGLKAVGDPADAAAAGGGEVELGNGADLAKKKRGRPPRAQAKSPPVKMSKEEDEDVCFICFDGGSLVLCDRRGCPKAYHPACVKRDEAFFRSKAKWNCGWHICSICQRAAHHMCYTCTYSLCKGCIKKADYVCVRGDKGFCTVCMKTIMLIENGGQEKDEKAQVDFDDKTSWEYLFKVYWIYLKGKLSLTLDELTQAKNPLKEASSTASVISSTNVHNGDNDPKNVLSTCVHNGDNDPKNVLSTCVHNGDNDQKNVSSDVSQNVEAIESKRRKTDEQISIVPHKETTPTKKPRTEERSSAIALKNWATKELLEFVAHMKNGDTSVLTQFDVQELMLEYIKRNSLRDPRKKSQIVCDSRLKILFGKPRVGHFEMLKLLEYHFFIKEDLPKNTIKSIAKQVDPDWNIDNMVTVGKEKKRRNHKKTEERTPQNKLDDYAAIDVHNMNLIYLRRKLMENLIGEGEIFHKKVVGSIVRIRITGSDQKHGMYRLVQVVGTSKADAPYKIGNKSADVVLEVLNLDKKENMSIDKISNQDLSEDECRRLRQSIKCGLVKRFTVGEIQDKAVSLQSVRLNDLMEAETLRLNNLRDRASEKGHKKRYPLMMIVNYFLTNFTLREYVEKLQLLKTPEERERRLREIPEVHSDPKMNPDYETDDTEEYFNKEHEYMKPKYTGISRKSTSSVKKEKDFSNNVNSRSRKNEEGHSSTKATGRINLKVDVHGPSSSGRPQSKVDYNGSTVTNRSHNSASETSTSSYTMKNALVSNNSELDKMWHYRDPSGKVQGPFCMVQLQKWSTTGYFPQDMKIWTNREDESLLLNDVLKQQLNVKTATDKVSIRVEGLTVRTTNLSSTQKTVNHGKLSGTHGATGQSSVQSWIANGTTNTPSFGKSNESNMTELASPTPVENDAGTNNVSSVFDIANADLPSPTPKETTTTNHVDEKVQNAVEKEAQNVGGAQLPGTSDHVVTTSANMEQAISSSSTPSSQPGDRAATTSANMEQAISSSSTPSSQPGDRAATTSANMEQAISSSSPSSQPGDRVATTSANMEQAISSSSTPSSQPAVLVATTSANMDQAISSSSPPSSKPDDHVVTTSANMEQAIPSSSPPSSQPGNNYLPAWQGVRETIEFSTLAEESVSDLLAEVDAMEAQNGFPSPTSRRNSFVEDLFNGSFEEFSPTPNIQGSRSDPFSSIGAEIHLPFQPTATTATTTTTTTTVGSSQGNSNNVFDFVKWPEIPQETISKDMIDVNNSVKADERAGETNASETSHDQRGGSGEHNEGERAEPTTTKSKDPNPELVVQSRTNHKEADDRVVQPATVDTAGPPPPSQPPQSQPLPQPMAVGLDKVRPRQGNVNIYGRPVQELTQVAPHLSTGRGVVIGWDPHQQIYGGDRFNKVEDSGYSRNGKPWVSQSSFGSGGNGIGNGGVGGYSRAPPKGQRVCKFYESGRCKKGASCNYWHP
ncbi:putative chromatin regulator PHD family [Helianthus annuus]|uniref:Chromatin regulator PHD family n=1 Tax=Helianthus annuus TaxID=4232 RepID=A0A251TX49_HELAN|nr:putative chromatin regulator PHD family [Helianthus annuus]KAJ0893545.1 putative chromatin regulator PHD family [Helianthus annuus]